MHANQEELLALHGRLKALAELPATTPGNYERIEALTHTLQQAAQVPLVAAQALDVRFKAEDLFHREHLMPEAILREMLLERLNRLEAGIRSSAVPTALLAI